VRFASPLFYEFHDLDDFAKITGREYLKSRAIFSVLLSSACKSAKFKADKTIS